jgi:hypothetical protein
MVGSGKQSGRKKCRLTTIAIRAIGENGPSIRALDEDAGVRVEGGEDEDRRQLTYPSPTTPFP